MHIKELHYFYNLKTFSFILILFFGLNFTSFAQNKIVNNNGNPTANLVKYYPNPATTAINFEFIQGYDKSFSLQLYNFMGKKVLELNSLTQLTNLSLNNLYRGVYFFQLIDKFGKVVDTGKFQVVK